jgi:hypothetical protein
LTVGHLRDVRAALDEIGDEPKQQWFPDFVIWPE